MNFKKALSDIERGYMVKILDLAVAWWKLLLLSTCEKFYFDTKCTKSTTFGHTFKCQCP